MDLNKEEVYKSVLNYKNRERLNNADMAKLLGMKSRQGFVSMMAKKTMALDNLVCFLNNTGKSFEEVFNYSENVNDVNEGSIKYKGDLAERVRRLEEEVETLNFIFEIARDKKKAQELIRKRQNEITK